MTTRRLPGEDFTPWDCVRCGTEGYLARPSSTAHLARVARYEAYVSIPVEKRVCARCVTASAGCRRCGALPGHPCSREGLDCENKPASWAIHDERRAVETAP